MVPLSGRSPSHFSRSLDIYGVIAGALRLRDDSHEIFQRCVRAAASIFRSFRRLPFSGMYFQELRNQYETKPSPVLPSISQYCVLLAIRAALYEGAFITGRLPWPYDAAHAATAQRDVAHKGPQPGIQNKPALATAGRYPNGPKATFIIILYKGGLSYFLLSLRNRSHIGRGGLREKANEPPRRRYVLPRRPNRTLAGGRLDGGEEGRAGERARARGSSDEPLRLFPSVSSYEGEGHSERGE